MLFENEQNIHNGTILRIMRMSTEDGPGIRTTVFFKGCPLRCTWCHNPESIYHGTQVQWLSSKCIGCKTCLDVCPNGALSFTSEGINIDRTCCKGCGDCVSECPSTAMDLLGQKWAVDELVDEVEKDGTYFEKSGGGITVSGGEPTMQAEFVAAFLRGCRERGLHTTLDTCGYCRREALQMFLPHVDMVLFDLKEIDPERHKTFTGSTNKEILENLIYLRDYVLSDDITRHGNTKEVWVRTPIIPNATARKDNIMGIGRFIGQHLGGIVNRWELCAFNNLCRDKYIRLGLTWSFKDCEPVTRSTMEDLSRVAKNSGVPPHIVHWSGSTKIEE